MSVLLFVCSFAAYLPSRSSAFVWDDQPYHLAGNAQLMRGEYGAFWIKPYRDFYIPVTYTVWTFIAQATPDHNGDLRPEPFRTVNLVVHATNSVLVLWLLYLLTQSPRPALLGATVFAIHPLQVESVVWISELRGLLAALFSLIALVLHCHYRRSDSRRTAVAVAAAMSFLVAVLAKPSATTLPLVVVALDLLVFHTRLPRAWWKWPLVWLGLSIPFMIVAKRVQPDAAVEFIPSVIGRVKVAADALTFYLGKLLLPWPLSPSYGRTPQTVVGWRPADSLLGLPAAIFFMAWRFRRAYPEWMLTAAIVLSGLAPVLGIIPFKGQNFSTVADRYMYFPLVGVALVVASLTDRIRLTRGQHWAAVMVIGVLLILNVRYQAVWHDEMTLWSHAATAYPNQPRVYNNYGAVLQAAGSQEEAISQFNLALKARPNFADAYCNRGSSLGRLHRYAEALADQTRALELDPTDAGCWYNRAVTLFDLGRFDQALADADRSETLGGVLPPGFKEAIQARLGARHSVPR